MYNLSLLCKCFLGGVWRSGMKCIFFLTLQPSWNAQISGVNSHLRSITGSFNLNSFPEFFLKLSELRDDSKLVNKCRCWMLQCGQLISTGKHFLINRHKRLYSTPGLASTTAELITMAYHGSPRSHDTQKECQLVDLTVGEIWLAGFECNKQKFHPITSQVPFSVGSFHRWLSVIHRETNNTHPHSHSQ